MPGSVKYWTGSAVAERLGQGQTFQLLSWVLVLVVLLPEEAGLVLA
jgi:hypothetical protein